MKVRAEAVTSAENGGRIKGDVRVFTHVKAVYYHVEKGVFEVVKGENWSIFITKNDWKMDIEEE